MELVRDVLDEPVVSLDRTPLGRVDGIVAEVRPDAPPRLVAIEMGPVVLARRVPTRAGAWLAAWLRRRGSRPFRIEWSRIRKIDLDVVVDIDPATTPAQRTERRLRRCVVDRVPGS
jgi:hypothetical protein